MPKYSRMNVNELREELRQLGLPNEGLKLNGVPNEILARLLPSAFEEKAAKIVNHLSLEQCKQYDVMKSCLQEAFNATA
jgi:SAP domain